MVFNALDRIYPKNGKGDFMVKKYVELAIVASMIFGLRSANAFKLVEQNYTGSVSGSTITNGWIDGLQKETNEECKQFQKSDAEFRFEFSDSTATYTPFKGDTKNSLEWVANDNNWKGSVIGTLYVIVPKKLVNLLNNGWFTGKEAIDLKDGSNNVKIPVFYGQSWGRMSCLDKDARYGIGNWKLGTVTDWDNGYYKNNPKALNRSIFGCSNGMFRVKRWDKDKPGILTPINGVCQ